MNNFFCFNFYWNEKQKPLTQNHNKNKKKINKYYNIDSNPTQRYVYYGMYSMHKKPISNTKTLSKIHN